MHLYEEHGEDCVRHLHGMFAFSLWDARRRVFRSTFGLSPSDVRGRAQATRVDASRPEPADIANGGYEEWVRQLK